MPIAHHVVSLGPLSPPLGGLCVEVVPLLLEPGPHLLELLMDLPRRLAHAEASSSFTVVPRVLISSRRRWAVALASAQGHCARYVRILVPGVPESRRGRGVLVGCGIRHLPLALRLGISL